MIVEIGIWVVITLCALIPYLKIKLESVKTVGICKQTMKCSQGSIGSFEYIIGNNKYYGGEKRTHLTSLKEGKEYTIYVKKDNYSEFVSQNVLNELMLFIIIGASGLLLVIAGGIVNYLH